MIKEFQETDQKLLEITRILRTLYYIEPINQKEEKEEFFKGKENPDFKYRDLEYDPDEIEQQLNEIRPPDNSPLSQIFIKLIDNLNLENNLIRNVGDSNIVKQASSIIHGLPSKNLVIEADKILKKLRIREYPETVPAKKIKEALEKELKKYNLEGWMINLTDKWLTSVNPSEKKINICKDRNFSESELKQLPIHEIGVHVLRAVNGYEQPLRIFAIGLPNYLSTEEGLSTYAEEITFNLSNNKMIDYASRVIAVDSALKGLSFRETFNRLKEYKLSDEFAWNVTIRAHSGGGYLKDHVYLEGYLKIKKFAENNGDFKTLFLGKIGLEDLPLIKELLNQGILKPAKQIPDFYNTI